MQVNIGPYSQYGDAEREISIHVDDYDIFNADHTLALVILPVLQKFKEISKDKGIPGEFYDKTKEDEGASDWHSILDKMIFSMQYIVDDEYTYPESLKVQEGLELFGKYFKSLWW